ncbi:hypothetical protein E5Q_04511 [Mixia osmundae IAM 14324]|uniref:Integrase zinc-binding domain-containing protein n=2 Tax=Mixia osmundae (strain CBS 9802 / IAM 14324 / JCM 22182 / KY 12970) TaxID=764103 RepID=G7E4S2_MIXOS|nr:hypothetical protein E5Q_04511 [Mixia osmundae IAM 14324]
MSATDRGDEVRLTSPHDFKVALDNYASEIGQGNRWRRIITRATHTAICKAVNGSPNPLIKLHGQAALQHVRKQNFKTLILQGQQFLMRLGKVVAIQDEYYDLIASAHVQGTQHLSANKTLVRASKDYVLLPRQLIKEFVLSCPGCNPLVSQSTDEAIEEAATSKGSRKSLGKLSPFLPYPSSVHVAAQRSDPLRREEQDVEKAIEIPGLLEIPGTIRKQRVALIDQWNVGSPGQFHLASSPAMSECYGRDDRVQAGAIHEACSLWSALATYTQEENKDLRMQWSPSSDDPYLGHRYHESLSPERHGNRAAESQDHEMEEIDSMLDLGSDTC